jgi:DNA repair protein RadC
MKMLIKDISKGQRPRERLIKYGVSSLSNQELLSIILKCGTKDKSVLELSNDILNKLSSLKNLKEYELSWLIEIKGVGIAKACEVLSAIELGKRINDESSNDGITRIRSSNDVFKYMKSILKDLKQECFYCIYLNNKNQVLERKLLFMGTVNKSIVHPREVFKEAYLCGATAIICIHNHPSGNVIPSKEDLKLTNNLKEVGSLLGIKVLDHIIIGKQKYYSFLENGDI